ncbi:rolling circle replication-associated protein [Vibrio rotiferianus]|uniref:rolling circle replication-associated protein n=1 Tax=Vibrio rotiferianus TaxID=190895 RepID=UPI00406A66FD
MNNLYEPQPVREFTNLLSPQDVGFVTALAQDVTITEKNIAAIDSGFFSAPNHDWMESELAKLKSFDQVHHHQSKDSAEIWKLVQDGKLTLITPEYWNEPKREAHAVGVKVLGSSKGAKVGHGKRKHIERFITRSRRMPPRQKTKSFFGVNATDEINTRSESQTGWVLSKEGNKKRLEWQPIGKSRAYLMRRDWSKQTKMQVVYHPSPSDAPEQQAGERFTEKLNPRAVKKIFESGAYVAACHGGFTTFLTLTFTPEQRAHIFGGESVTDEGLAYCPIQTTIGAEVSRFLNAAKKVYQRGFEYDATQFGMLNLDEDTTKVSGYGKQSDFHYIWVAECPANEDGEPNPHVHLLLNWQVEPCHFRAWAKRLEALWGHGMAHLERIKYGEAASGYLIKAVGYAAKGDNADQGLIKGNRYNIARCSRAPDWDVLASFDVDNMTGIIQECGYRLQQWRKPLVREIKRKQDKKAEYIKAIDINKKKSNLTAVAKLQRLISKIENETRSLKEVIKSRGTFASASNQFAITFEGERANEKANDFLCWAHGARGWSMQATGEDETTSLDLFRSEARIDYSAQLQAFRDRQCNWASLLAQEFMPPRDRESINANNMALYEEYCATTH